MADEHVRIFHRKDVTQNLRQFGHPELTSSTGAVTELGQPDLRPFVPGLVGHGLLVLGDTLKPSVRMTHDRGQGGCSRSWAHADLDDKLAGPMSDVS